MKVLNLLVRFIIVIWMLIIKDILVEEELKDFWNFINKILNLWCIFL